MLTEKQSSLIQGKCWPAVDARTPALPAPGFKPRGEATWDLFLINLGGLRQPVSIHFINLFVLFRLAKWGGDYSNLAQSTSTSHVLTPFCHVWPPRQSATSRPEKQASTRPACAAPRIPVGLAQTSPKSRFHIVAENRGPPSRSALAISVCL